MYKYLFGPVPSRRLGMSLGVDLVSHKTCSLDCIYCECGKTTDLTIERKEYVPCDEVIQELEHYFQNNPDPDYFTFSGSGEPTLNSKIGIVLEFLKKSKPGVKIAVLTNGTLLSLQEVRRSLLNADLVMPSLDAATTTAFKKINNPCEEIDIEKYIKGLSDFRQEYKGELNLEVFILPGYNDSIQDLLMLKQAIDQIKPDAVQLNTLDRPGVISGIHAATKAELEQIALVLGNDNIEIIASANQRKDLKSYRSDMESTILETIKRRPCTLEDLAKILGTHINEINKYLTPLEQDGRIESIYQERGLFYHTRNKKSE